MHWTFGLKSRGTIPLNCILIRLLQMLPLTCLETVDFGAISKRVIGFEDGNVTLNSGYVGGIFKLCSDILV